MYCEMSSSMCHECIKHSKSRKRIKQPGGTGRPFLKRGLLKWALPIWGSGGGGGGGVRTLARMVYALFSSINVKKQAKEGNFLQTLELYIRCILIAGKM